MILGSQQWRGLIASGAATMGVGITSEHLAQFAVHAQTLDRWNQRINLTAISDPGDVAVKHFIDSLALVPLIPGDSFLLDIGSGAGFPGIPLKVAIPSITVMLIDASRKKVSFLRHLIRALGLKDIEARHIRAEEMVHEGGFSNAFDVIVSRAMTTLDDLVAMADPLLKNGGILLAMKGRENVTETVRMRSFIGNGASGADSSRFRPALKRYILPHSLSERSLMVLKKR